MRANNLTLLTDLYELTMMQGYFKNPTNQTVIFDMFYRNNPCGGGFAICAGLEQMIEYIENLRFAEEDITYLRSLGIFEEDFLEYLSNFKFTGDIYAIPEGTVIFPREPMVKVIAPIMEAQLVETAILNIMNHQSLIATKAARVCHAAKGAEDTENEMFFHNGYLYGSFINLFFLAVFGVYPPVGKDGDYHGGNAACDYHPEEVGIADSFLNVTGKHARNHHAQRHECGADGIV